MRLRTVLVHHDTDALLDTAKAASRTVAAGLLAVHRPKRCDTLIASALLVLLLAGWVMNFVSIKQMSMGLGSIIAHASTRQT